MKSRLTFKDGKAYETVTREVQPWYRCGDNFYSCTGCGLSGYAANAKWGWTPTIGGRGEMGAATGGADLRLFVVGNMDKKHHQEGYHDEDCPFVLNGVVPRDALDKREQVEA